jgi:hypothetical protein
MKVFLKIINYKKIKDYMIKIEMHNVIYITNNLF